MHKSMQVQHSFTRCEKTFGEPVTGNSFDVDCRDSWRRPCTVQLSLFLDQKFICAKFADLPLKLAPSLQKSDTKPLIAL